MEKHTNKRASKSDVNLSGHTKVKIDPGLRARLNTQKDSQGQLAAHSAPNRDNANYRRSRKTSGFKLLVNACIGRLRLLVNKSGRLITKHYKFSYFGLLVLAVAGLLIMQVHDRLEAKGRYVLSSAVQQIIPSGSKAMAEELSYSPSTKTYTLNKQAYSSTTSTSNSVQIGSGTTDATTLFGAKIPVNPKTGLSMVDKTTGISMNITPQFGSQKAEIDNASGKPITDPSDTVSTAHFVYPVNNQPAETVYTIENNGIKEDVVLNSSPGGANNGSISLSYNLNLPDTLKAKLLSNGNVGVYSASSQLFGNITYSTSSDRQLIEKDRVDGAKNNLVFILPAPVITQYGNKPLTPGSSAKFSLKGNVLTVTASNLNGLKYPIAIDPSLVDGPATGALQSSGTNQYGISFNGTSNNEITTGNVGGGTLTAGWTEQNDTNGTGYNGSCAGGGGAAGGASVAYNGYLYVMGGRCEDNETSVTSIDYQAITSTGALSGSSGWTVTSPSNCFSANNNYSFGAVVYNGYLYIVGGTPSTGGVTVTTVQYAQINSNGSVGSCTNTSNLNTAIQGMGVTAYDGYLYAIGGCTANCLGSANYQSTVESAPIYPSGAIGAFTNQTNSLPAAETVTSAVYNGYIYAAANCLPASGVRCSAATTATDYAPLEPSGGIGVWNATSSFAANEIGQSMIESGGYLYLIGGYNSGIELQTVQYAQIDSDGTLGPWSTTTSILAATGGSGADTGREFAMDSSYNNVLYITGGEIGTQIDYAYDTQYAPLDSPGGLGAAVSNTTLPAGGNESQTSVVYNNYVYLLGGCSSTCPTSAVYYSKVTSGSGGTLGAWNSTTSLPAVVRFGASVVADGYIYVMGGGGGANSNTVYFAQIDQANGKLDINGYCGSVWCTTATLLNSVETNSAVAYNGYIYEIGGNDGVALSEVDYAQVNPANGELNINGPCGSDWCQTNSLTTASVFGATQEYNGYIYAVIGDFSSTVDIGTICNGTNSNNGCSTGSTPCGGGTGVGCVEWSASSASLPALSAYASMVVDNGYLYVLGGQVGFAEVATIYDIQIESNGSLNSAGWSTSPATLTTAVYSASAVAADGYLYNLGGNNGAGGIATVDSFQINNNGPGGVVSWNSGTSLSSPAQAVEQAASVAYDGYLYELGGNNGTSPIDNTYYTPISVTGSIGSWTTGTNLPNSNNYDELSAVAYDGLMYVIGGYSGSSAYDTIYYTTINASTGALGSSWTQLATLPSSIGIAYPSSVIYNGYLYLVGGTQSGSPANLVSYAKLGSSGMSLGSWQTATSLPVALTETGVETYDGYLYVIGGYNGSSSVSSVYYAAINSNGSLGAWSPAESIPLPAKGIAVASYNGYMYVIGGDNGTSNYNTVFLAPINNNGSLGNWTETYGIGASTTSLSAVTYNGFIYELGGLSGISPTSTVSYAGLDSIPEVASFSDYLALTGIASDNPVPYAVLLTGTNNNSDVGNYGNPSLGGNSGPGTGGIQLSYFLANTSTACSNGVYGSAATTANVPTINGLINLNANAPAGGCSSLNSGQDLNLIITLDDSQTASFPDLTANHTTVNSITVYYHPQTNTRLRGGATFTSTGLQSLDAP